MVRMGQEFDYNQTKVIGGKDMSRRRGRCEGVGDNLESSSLFLRTIQPLSFCISNIPFNNGSMRLSFSKLIMDPYPIYGQYYMAI